jgi:type I restriction enzyme S subunit
VSELLKTWKVVSLVDIAEIQMGQSPDSSTYNDKRDGLPFFQGKTEFGKLNPTVKKWCSDPKKIAEKGDILLSIRAPVGPSNVAIEKCAIGRGLASLRAREPVNQNYLFHFIRNLEPWLTLQGTGSTFAAVSGDFVRTIEIPVAPLAEQKRIADKLDTVLARVDACRERLNRVPLILKRFKQSVLAAATSGKLTKEWCDLHARDQDWTTVKFGDVLNEMRNGLSPKPSDEPIGKKILRISAVRQGRIDYTDYKYLVLNEKDELQYSLASGDLLFTRYNGSLEFVGVCALVGEEGKGYVYPDKLIRIRVNKKIVDAKYIQIVFGSSEVRAIIENFVKSTSGQKGISGGDLKSVEFRLPTILEQHEIVRRVETLFTFADRLEARLATARNATERLTPALLAKAFRGELVDQDPNDEPAIELLKRLKSNLTEKTKPLRRGATK